MEVPPIDSMVGKYTPRSDPDVVRRGAIAARIPRVGGAGRLDQHDLALARGGWLVLDAARHDEHLARLQRDGAVTKLDRQLAFHHDERFISLGVAVPDELPIHAGELELIVVHLG